VFVCGTAAEVIGLREIDFRPIGSGRTGPITRALQDSYRAAVSGNHPRSAGWLAPVDAEGRPTRAHDDLRVAV
jgi:branched-chain amino acid aminotransferase